MKIVRFLKKLNNSELGYGNVHQSYIRVDKNINLDDFHFTPSKNEVFVYRPENKEYKNIHFERYDNETRLAGFSQFFRDFDIKAEDYFIIESVQQENDIKYFLDFEKNDNIICFHKDKLRTAFEPLTETKVSLIENKVFCLDGNEFKIRFKLAAKKRNDSPSETKFYDLLSNNSLIFDLIDDEYIELKISNNNIIIQKRVAWKKYSIEIGEQ